MSPVHRLRLVLVQLVLAVGLAGLVVLAHGGLDGFFAGFDPACSEPVCDWTRHYVPTALALGQTGLPTWGYVYPPTLAVLAWPLAGTPAGTGAWVALLIGAQLALAVAPPHLLPRTPPGLALAFTALTALAVPTLEVLDWGQVSALLVLLGLLGFYLLERTPGAGGGLIGAAVAMKVYPVLLLPWMLVRRRFADLAVCLGVTVVLAGGLPALVLGLDGTLAFYQAAAAELARLVPAMQHSIGPQSLVSVIERVVLDHSSAWRPVLTVGSVLLGLGQLALLLVLPRRRPHDAWIWSFVLSYGAFPLFIASSWLHYFGHLPLAWLLLGRTLLLEAPERRLGIGVALVASAALGIWPAWLILGHAWYPALGVLLGSHLMALAGLGLVLLEGPATTEPADPVASAPPERV